MNQYYSFPQPGCIGGIPGTFSGVSVTVNDNGSLTIVPLSPYPDFETAEELAETLDVETAEEDAGGS